MPPKKSLTNKQIERLKQRREFIFLVGVELFSRYAFVDFYQTFNPYRPEDGGIKLDEVEVSDDLTEVTKDGMMEDAEDDGDITGMSANDVIKSLTKWFKEIKDMDYELHNFITDEGSEFKNVAVKRFLDKGGDGIFKYPINQGFTVPNDRTANPVAERFIGTFKRLFGQFYAVKGVDPMDVSINQMKKDVDKMLEFYNSRVHSSTGYTPKEILKDNETSDTLFEIYRHQKSEVYLTDTYKPLNTGDHVRVFYKWKTPDANIGNKKSNVQNFSYTIFRITGLNKKDNHYFLSPLGDRKDPRDKFFEMPSKRGVRKDLVLRIDYDAFKRMSGKD